MPGACISASIALIVPAVAGGTFTGALLALSKASLTWSLWAAVSVDPGDSRTDPGDGAVGLTIAVAVAVVYGCGRGDSRRFVGTFAPRSIGWPAGWCPIATSRPDRPAPR